jgi:hypothetical protein
MELAVLAVALGGWGDKELLSMHLEAFLGGLRNG